jgi:predicted metalloenzyme YecM
MITAAEPSTLPLLEFLYNNDLDKVLEADHICFKCASTGEYDAMRHMLEFSPQFCYMHQSFISGRRVAYFRFTEGFPFGERSISYLELSDKKPDEDEVAGFHHIELYPVTGTLQQLIAMINEKHVAGALKERPHHTTYDVTLHNGFIIRLCDVPLIQKIAQEITQ